MAAERVFKAESGRVLAGLISKLSDFDLAEEALQEACARALETWPADGLPRNPAAWLTTAAARFAIDQFRRNRMRNRRHEEIERATERVVFLESQIDELGEISDERLRLIFTCCHPSLSQDAQISLTLRTLGGLTTAEISRAFLVPEATLAQRLVRAKRKIRDARIPYRVPAAAEMAERLDSVLATVYLIFNEGYSASSGEQPVRADLCGEAIRLCRVLESLLPEEPEVLGLLALMLLHDSRRASRTDEFGALVVLEDQDRLLWNARSIADGLLLLRKAARQGQPGIYQTQAAISAVHAESASFAETDWSALAQLYGALELMQPSPVVRLNRVVAQSRIEGPAFGLRELEDPALLEVLHHYQPFHAARADMLRRLGEPGEARQAYLRALGMTQVEAERNYLKRRLDELDRH